MNQLKAKKFIPLIAFIIGFGAVAGCSHVFTTSSSHYHPGHRSKTTPLVSAVKANNLALVQQLLKSGANPDTHYGDDFSPLGWAAITGHAQIARLLQQHGATFGSRSHPDDTTDLDIAAS